MRTCQDTETALPVASTSPGFGILRVIKFAQCTGFPNKVEQGVCVFHAVIVMHEYFANTRQL